MHPEEKPLSRTEIALRAAGFKPANGNVIDFQSAMNNSDNPNLGVFGGEPEKLTRADRALAYAGFKRKT
ncbi:hypothetical protein IHQ71_28380 [Rhizobium sp. TH2]|uniref:hypothetical protein n=1 Tax=Rhizobium sp. TH2 TaxID=2775403 RepID=UPI002158890F|nr:hypothetical protein [Rhizobium sp. TH2]UVC08982.1 hypothetical protein IHQ71_28380 [Rhizobium sp. TH2]